MLSTQPLSTYILFYLAYAVHVASLLFGCVCMTCVNDVVMLCSVMLMGYCMLICDDALRAELLFAIGRDGPLRPGVCLG